MTYSIRSGDAPVRAMMRRTTSMFAASSGPADVVGLAGRAVLQHVADAAREVLHVDPVAHLQAVAVDRQRVAVERVEDHQRDQLLRVLVRAVVVRAAADQRLEPVGVVVGADEQVGAGLGGRVGEEGERRGLRERPSSIEP